MFHRYKRGFFAQNSDENRARRQKLSISHLKMTTRMGLVAKNEDFSSQNGDENGLVAKKSSVPPQNDDENGARRQKMMFSTQKW